jgi:hypothetical protein
MKFIEIKDLIFTPISALKVLGARGDRRNFRKSTGAYLPIDSMVTK